MHRTQPILSPRGVFVLSLVAALLSAGCGSSSPEPAHAEGDTTAVADATYAPTTQATYAPQTNLIIEPLRIGGGEADDLVMGASGVVTVADQSRAIGTVQPDGRFVDHRGHILLVLRSDGSIVDWQGQLAQWSISPADTLQDRNVPGREIRIDPNGTVVGVVAAGEQAGTQPMGVVQGLTPHNRRTAAFLLAIGAIYMD